MGPTYCRQQGGARQPGQTSDGSNMGSDSCSHVASTPATSRDPGHAQRVSFPRTSFICASRIRSSLVVPCGKRSSLETGLDRIISERVNAPQTRQGRSWPEDFRRGRRDDACRMTAMACHRGAAARPTAKGSSPKVRLQGFSPKRCRDSLHRRLSPPHKPLRLTSASAIGSRDAPYAHGYDVPARLSLARRTSTRRLGLAQAGDPLQQTLRRKVFAEHSPGKFDAWKVRMPEGVMLRGVDIDRLANATMHGQARLRIPLQVELPNGTSGPSGLY